MDEPVNIDMDPIDAIRHLLSVPRDHAEDEAEEVENAEDEAE